MKMIDNLHNVLDTMRLPNGAYTASRSHDYNYVWIRDVCYTVLPYLNSFCTKYESAYYALLDLLKKYEWKIDIHTKQKPYYPFEYIHARYSTNLEEIDTEWGHAQNDAIGAFLFGIGEGLKHGKKMIRDEKDREIIQKLIYYLDKVEFWQDEDNGIWEENREVHASSVGACVAGLRSVNILVDVPDQLIKAGEDALACLLPRESKTKDTDLALLSLIYPYRVVNHQMGRQILEDITLKLERTYGCIRYLNDQYYNEGSEAEWCFGFPWLGLSYMVMGRYDVGLHYWEKTKKIIPADGKIPELYIGGINQPNVNTPLAWAVAMSILLGEKIDKKYREASFEKLHV